MRNGISGIGILAFFLGVTLAGWLLWAWSIA